MMARLSDGGQRPTRDPRHLLAVVILPLLRELEEEWQYPADEYGPALATALGIDWQAVLGDDIDLSHRPCYIRGFVAGAAARWAGLKDRL